MEKTPEKHHSLAVASAMQVDAKPHKEFIAGYKMDFKEMQCPECKRDLVLKYVFIGSWPYVHADVCFKCICGFQALFGLPEDPLRGMELIIWDTRPQRVLAQALKLPAPECVIHHKPMALTKIWGDIARLDPERVRVQWKCPRGFLTHHEWMKREGEQ